MEKLVEKYGCPPALRSAIARMYKDSRVRLLMGKIDTTIPLYVGTKQGDSMAPVLFLFITMGFSKTLEREWTKNGLTPLQFRRHDNSPLSNGSIISHKRCTFSEGTLFDMFCMLYVDDGAFAFPSRKEIELGSAVICQHFAKFGLEMHVSSATKASKTEAVFFPDPRFFKLLNLPPSEAPSSFLTLATKTKKESEKSRRSREDKC